MRVSCGGPCPPGVVERAAGVMDAIVGVVVLAVVLAVVFELYRVRTAEPLVERLEADR